MLPIGLKHRVITTLARPKVIIGLALSGALLVVTPVIVLAVGAVASTDLTAESPHVELAKTKIAEKIPANADASATPAPKAAPMKRTADGKVDNNTRLIAFYANWDDLGYKSLAANIDEIDVLMPMWYHLDSKGKITVDNQEKQDEVMALIRDTGANIKVMPILNNYDKPSEKWNAPAVGRMLADPKKRKEIAKQTVTVMKNAGFDGVNIDFESFTANDKSNIVAFMAELYPLAHKAGLEVSMDVIVSGAAYDHRRLAQHVDYLIPMMYDEHWKTSGPGAISSLPWYERTLNRFYSLVPPEKVVVGLGTYTYDWGKSGQRAKSGTFADAVALSKKYSKPMKVDSAKLNSTFTYTQSGVKHSVWVLDAISAFNQMSASAKRPPRGFAIWRLGAEDPDVWKVFPFRDSLDESIATSLKSAQRSIEFDAGRAMIVRGSTHP